MRRSALPWGAAVISFALALGLAAPSYAIPRRVARLDPYLRWAARLAPRLETPSTRGPALARLRQLDHTIALELDARPPSAVVRVAGHPTDSALAGVGARLVSPGAAARLVRVPLRSLEQLAAAPGVRFVEAQARVRTRLDVSVPLTGAQSLHDGNPTVTGAGVVYGSVDDGIDIRHPTFRNPDGTTRVEAFWDVCDMSGDPPPGFEDFGGTLYTAEDINAQLAGEDRFPHVDVGGHGTMTAGIGAGSGDDGTLVGMAPGASIVVVAIFGEDEWGTCDNANVMNDFGGGSSVVSEGARFIESWAAGRPFVVNMSLGDHVGPHDGSSLLDGDLAEIADGPGRALVAAAGNEAEGGVHAGINLPGDGTIYGIDAAGLYGYDGAVEIWYPGAADVEVRVRQEEVCGDPVAKGGDVETGAYHVDNAHGGPDGRNGDNVVLVDVFGDLDPAKDEAACTSACDHFIELCDGADPFGDEGSCQTKCMGAWNADRVGCVAEYEPRWGSGCDGVFFECLPVEFTVEVRALGGQPARADLYGTGFATALDGAPGPDMTIGEPASSYGTIAVGAFVHRDGQFAQGNLGELTTYSSHGPLRDGRDKPEIAAPAELVTSALAYGYDPYGADVSRDGLWQTISGGTSAASPHVAGALALLFEVHPEADLADIHEALARGAIADADTGQPPDDGWGWGKLQIADAILSLDDALDDVDGDGFGAAAAGGIDCDDADPAKSPRMPEVAANGIDDDCDRLVDEVLPESGFFERIDPECPDELEPDAGPDAGPPPVDAGTDAEVDADVDASAPIDGDRPGMHAHGGGCDCGVTSGMAHTNPLAWLGLALALTVLRRGRR